MQYSKLLNHPDLDEILAKIASGEKYSDISDFTKKKYPNDKSKIISESCIQRFIRNGIKAVRDDKLTVETLKQKIDDFINDYPEPEITVIQEIAEEAIETLPTVADSVKDLFNDCMIGARTVLNQAINNEREMKDFKYLMDGFNVVQNLYDKYGTINNNQRQEIDTYESFIQQIDIQVEDNQNDD